MAALECEQFTQPREQRKRYRILLSSFSPEEKASLANIIKELGGIYFDTPNFVASCTHIICGKPNRGEKFLCGCALGKWILRKEFLLDSHKSQNWLAENMYEWCSNQEFEKIPMSHVLAPRRWRNILSKKSCDSRPFGQWKAIVVVSDANRRLAYKRLLEAGGASVVSGKPPYDIASLIAGKLTHVFTERNLEPVIAGLRKAGLPCLSPDFIPEYILRDPIPQAAEFDIKSYNPKRVVQSTMIRCQRKALNTPTLPLGCSLYKRATRSSRNKENKENSQATVCEKGQECHQSNAMKRKKKLPAGLIPSSKKSKKVLNFLNSDWLNVSTHCNVYQSKNTKVGSATKTRRKAQFGSYIRNAVDSCLEENVVNGALEAISSFLSSNRFPPSITVHAVMQDILLKSPATALSYKAYNLLQRLLYLHPPSVNRELYQMALMTPQECSGTDLQTTRTLWDFVRKPIRFLLGLESNVDGTQTVEQGEVSGLESSFLLLKFLVSLLEKDFADHVGPCSISKTC